jgi:hypothetical protein
MLDFSHTKIDFRRSIFSYNKVLTAIDFFIGPAIRKRAVRNSVALANEKQRGIREDYGDRIRIAEILRGRGFGDGDYRGLW